MISVDTNVLIRMLVDDPGLPGQVRAARDMATKAGQILITQIVQVEAMSSHRPYLRRWALMRRWKRSRRTVAHGLTPPPWMHA